MSKTGALTPRALHDGELVFNAAVMSCCGEPRSRCRCPVEVRNAVAEAEEVIDEVIDELEDELLAQAEDEQGDEADDGYEDELDRTAAGLAFMAAEAAALRDEAPDDESLDDEDALAEAPPVANRRPRVPYIPPLYITADGRAEVGGDVLSPFGGWDDHRDDLTANAGGGGPDDGPDSLVFTTAEVAERQAARGGHRRRGPGNDLVANSALGGADPLDVMTLDEV